MQKVTWNSIVCDMILVQSHQGERKEFDDIIFEEPDNEEMFLQDAMEELMVESDSESLMEDLEAEIIVQVPAETSKES